MIRVDFPEPETPVTQTTPDKGIFTFRFLILFWWQPFNSIKESETILEAGSSIFSLPFKKAAVFDFLFLRIYCSYLLSPTQLK